MVDGRAISITIHGKVGMSVEIQVQMKTELQEHNEICNACHN